MTKEIATLMVSKLLDVAVFNIVREVIIKLCSHECVILESEPDMDHNDTVKHPRDEFRYNNYEENDTNDQPDMNHDESHTVKQQPQKETFRNFVVNVVQNRFEFLLGNISQAPLKMLSLIIVISRLFSGRFISRVILAKICDDLFNRRNDTNGTFFIISYINIILEICTPTLLETHDGERLREEILSVRDVLIAAARAAREEEKKQEEKKKRKERKKEQKARRKQKD
jgi:hypothetical protein